jgi:ubiquinone/menaquinone biosynthesis C-methylase UbiE
VPVIFTPWAERLIDRATIQEGDHVLDIASGTGIVARLSSPLVGETGSVVGVDNDEGMLAVATKTAAEEGLTIEWQEADATDLPFAEERFDIVLCQQGLPFFDDPIPALREMRRVVASDGRVLLNVGRPLEYQPGWEVLAEALSRHIGDEWGAMMHGPFPSWDGDYLQQIAQDAGFDDVSVTIDIGSVRFPSVETFISRQAATSPLAEPIGNAPQAVRDELIQDVEDELEGYTDDDGIVFPFESYVMEVYR